MRLRRAARLSALAVAVALILALQPASPPRAATPQAPTLAVSVQGRLPHDQTAFTQGLILHQGEFVESTGLYNASTLRRVDPQTGRARHITRLPGRLFAEGLALCPPSKGAPPRLALLTWREGRILTFDAATLRQLSQHPLRGEGWGLASDGARLILSDGTDGLRLLEPKDYRETGRVPVRDGETPVRELNELEWVNGWLLANVWNQDRIAVIRPPGVRDQGQVAAWLDLAPLRRELRPGADSANGIAFDPASGTLYVTGKRWDKIFVLALPPLLAQPPR
ncbi:MAG: glutaminyl-peptide cyclotransferase [Humidesulfovibrio sp.]|uniref:glutaminyl-peptide cyclotransferase n=1 Tax=Humidesulfovibrio sp. TaxID=2910988 RepID=UPI0027F6D6F9|nr:glutaminyl-peptide cyclotransferase [Humidesulfovibrio sp.]MDQ7836658.1 glutaminyl-peptide cyclotransferase [Humidesulfovibrio sp.]